MVGDQDPWGGRSGDCPPGPPVRPVRPSANPGCHGRPVIPSPAAPGILVTHHMIQPLGFPGKSGFPPGWSEKLSNRTLPLKIGFSRPGTPRNRFVLKFCVGWYFQNRFSLEKCLKSTTFDFLVGSWIIGVWLVLISVFGWFWCPGEGGNQPTLKGPQG